MLRGKYLAERCNGAFQIVGAGYACRSTLGSPAGFSAPLPPPIPQRIPGGGSFAVGIRESVMPDRYDLPLDLEKMLQSVRRLNGLIHDFAPRVSKWLGLEPAGDWTHSQAH
jgi:hypothetical protein